MSTSDVIVGLAIAVPVLAAAGGAAVAVRLRSRGGGDGPGRVADEVIPEAVEDGPPVPPAPTAVPLRPGDDGAGDGAGAAPILESDGTDIAARSLPPAVAEVAEPPTYRGRMGKARSLLSGYLGAVRSKANIERSTWDDLEEALIRADVGVASTDALIDDLRSRVKSGKISTANVLIDALKDDLVTVLSAGTAGVATHGIGATPPGPGSVASGPGVGDDAGSRPPVDVWLFVGVNGVGKTTTVGKVASRLSSQGAKVLLAAGDTFRAAAAEQLETWAVRAGADMVRGTEGGDPSSVVFDAVQRAASKGHTVVLADTAGRLHNKLNLIEELKKVRRVADRPPGRVVEVLLVLDATTGQNGLAQAKVFTEAVDVTGVVLTKLDGTAKGGIVVAIQRELGVPVKLVGLGEGVGDLVDFDAEAFVDALF
ncbi:MAG: signal recognition particle-docking protein FtsY [Acidimicrobiales bacterium]